MIRVAFDGLLFSDRKIGIVNYIHYMILEFIREDNPNFEIDVFINAKYSGQFENKAINVKFIPIKIKSYVHRFFKQYTLGLVLKNKYNLLLSPDYPRTFYLHHRIKSIVVIPDASIRNKRSDFLFFRYLIKRVGYKWAIHKADAILTYSQSVVEDLLKYYPVLCSKRVVPLWLGKSPQFEIKDLQNEIILEKVRITYNLPKSYFIFVGTVMPRKNLLGVIKAFDKIYYKIPHDLVVVGSKGWKYGDLFDYLNSSMIKKRTHFLGYVPDIDLPALYKQAQFLVFPSFDEGFGIPIIEAFATECPVITSNLSSMKEIAEGYALLVNPYDIDELSIAMLHMSVDKKLQKKYKCLSKEAALRFSWKETVRNTFNLIEDICSNPTE